MKKKGKIKDFITSMVAYAICILIIIATIMALLWFISFIGHLLTWKAVRISILVLCLIGTILFLINEFGKEE